MFYSRYNFKENVVTIAAKGPKAGLIKYWTQPIYALEVTILYSLDETMLLTEYLYCILKRNQNILYAKAYGTLNINLYFSQIQNIKIPIIPIEEQKIIIAANSYEQKGIN